MKFTELPEGGTGNSGMSCLMTGSFGHKYAQMISGEKSRSSKEEGNVSFIVYFFIVLDFF